ncbi:MAG: ribosome small subunit-dependent GTPase A [Firmicutes bacterium]|nr:ribosome small subunit-dependent GTPase A [Bacillota bacterium]
MSELCGGGLRFGIITRGVGGKYSVLSEGEALTSHAKGAFRHDDITPAVGDFVTLAPRDDGIYLISEIGERKNHLMRPPVSNLDMLFVIVPICRPKPDTLTVDKLLSIAEHEDIPASVVITKCELDCGEAEKIADIYTRAGYRVFRLSAERGEGVCELRDFISSLSESTNGAPEKYGKYSISSFAGASGAGKSTLLNALYPSLSLTVGALSRKTARGRQTTRKAELYDVGGGVLIADTAGFSLIDFEKFDFFSLEALPFTFREFEPYHGRCRFTKCTHTSEIGCAVIEAVEAGIIARERHESYRELYALLRSKNPWDKKPK